MSHNTKPGGPVNYTAILAPLREVNERLRARAEAAEAELADARERLRQVTQECQALAERWMRNEAISADYQNALADAASITDPDEIDEACTEYEQGADEAYWAELERTARNMLEDDAP